jgi:uncharacterized membrane protein SpoIIM required for sporulation
MKRYGFKIVTHQSRIDKETCEKYNNHLKTYINLFIFGWIAWTFTFWVDGRNDKHIYVNTKNRISGHNLQTSSIVLHGFNYIGPAQVLDKEYKGILAEE